MREAYDGSESTPKKNIANFKPRWKQGFAIGFGRKENIATISSRKKKS